MKTLKNQTLLYDEDCPLCRVYTSGFIKAGMLDINGKKAYCQLSVKEQDFVDVKRASNEIALVDNINKTVVYGIDSLLKVIGFSFPWMEKIGNLRPINFFLKKLYSFVSYNRKVIIPGKINKNIQLQCVPDFSFKYRLLFILFAATVSGCIFQLLSNTFSTKETMGFQIGSLIFQSLLILKFSKEITVNYLGNFSVSFFCGSLLLLPIIILKSLLVISEIVAQLYFITIFLVVILDIFRRIQIIKFNLS